MKDPEHPPSLRLNGVFAEDFVSQKLDNPMFLEDYALYNAARDTALQFNEAIGGRDVFAYE